MNNDLTPRQQILLWDLVARGGGAPQKDIKPEVRPADRKPLVEGRYISSTKGVRGAITLSIEERGWYYIGTVAPSLLKSGGGSIHDRTILQFVLQRIQAFAAAQKVTFARIFVPSASGAEGTNTTPEQPLPARVEDEVEAAFFAIAGRPPVNHVRLRALRSRLAKTPRGELDRALAGMKASGRARFSTLNNPADIAKEGDAPLAIDGRTFHTIWIDP